MALSAKTQLTLKTTFGVAVLVVVPWLLGSLAFLYHQGQDHKYEIAAQAKEIEGLAEAVEKIQSSVSPIPVMQRDIEWIRQNMATGADPKDNSWSPQTRLPRTGRVFGEDTDHLLAPVPVVR